MILQAGRFKMENLKVTREMGRYLNKHCYNLFSFSIIIAMNL